MACPFYPQQQTSSDRRGKSGLCQKATWKAGPLSHNSSMSAFRKPGEHSLVMSQFELFVRASSVHELAVLLARQTAAETNHLVPWMNACISSSVSLPSLLLSIALKIRS